MDTINILTMKPIFFIFIFAIFFCEQCSYFNSPKKLSKKFENMTINEKRFFLNGFISGKGDFEKESNSYSDTLYQKLLKFFPPPKDIKLVKKIFEYSTTNMISISKIKDLEKGNLVSEGIVIVKDYLEVNHKYKFHISYFYNGILFKVEKPILERIK